MRIFVMVMVFSLSHRLVYQYFISKCLLTFNVFPAICQVFTINLTPPPPPSHKAESKAQWRKSHLPFSKIINMLIRARLRTGNQECNFPSSECRRRLIQLS